MESDSWPQIYAGIQQHLQKIYNGKKTALKERYWVPKEDETYDLERNRRKRPSHISETSATREYPSLIHTFFLTHTIGGVFLNPEDKAFYDEMLRLQCLGSNTPRVCPTLRMRSWPLFVGASSEGTFLVLNEFCQDWAQSFLPHLKARILLIFLGSKRDDEDGSEDEEDEDDSPMMSPGYVARERIPFEIFRSTYPGCHVARERHLEELHVTWAHLEKKRTRLRAYTNIFLKIMFSAAGDGVGADVVSMGIPYTAQAADIQDDVAVRRMEEIKVKVFYRALRWRPILHRSIPE
nr:hypothetical protein [Tanacetum cinerariifolium]